jgi:hypothetical protein
MKPPDQFQLGVIIMEEGRVCQQSLEDKLSADSYLEKEKGRWLPADSYYLNG